MPNSAHKRFMPTEAKAVDPLYLLAFLYVKCSCSRTNCSGKKLNK